MLRAWIPQARAAVASTSNNPSLHTSAVLSAESARKRIARADKKVNLRKREERLAYAAANRPHVVLGTRPGEDHKWTDSDLAKCVLTEESILASGEPVLSVRGPIGEVPLPAHLNYGVTEPDARLLFSTLPALAGEVNADEKRIREHRRDALFEGDARKLAQVAEQAQAEEQRKAEMLARVVDLRNANAGGIAYENRRRIVEAFSEPGKPGDTGRTEVQAAIMTMRIRNLWTHLTRHKKDVGNRLSLRKLIHQRAKMLKYLKSTSRDRYEILLPRIGVEPEAVEGELIV